MTTTTDPKTLIEKPMSVVAGIDPSEPEKARAALEAAYPSDGPDARALRDALVAAVEAGTLCDRGEEPMKYSRLRKPRDNDHELSVDVVDMSGPGPKHRHPQGELNLCFALDGDPRFDGHPEGWVVFPPNSAHVPTVSGGRMLIAYFLPQGAMEFVKE